MIASECKQCGDVQSRLRAIEIGNKLFDQYKREIKCIKCGGDCKKSEPVEFKGFPGVGAWSSKTPINRS